MDTELGSSITDQDEESVALNQRQPDQSRPLERIQLPCQSTGSSLPANNLDESKETMFECTICLDTAKEPVVT